MGNKVRLKKWLPIVVKDGGGRERETGNTKDTELQETYD